MSSFGTTTIFGDLTVTGDIKGNGGVSSGNYLPSSGGTLTGDLVIRKTSPVSLQLIPTDNVQDKGVEVVFGSTDNQHVRIRANHYDTVRAPFGLHIEKCTPNAQTGLAYLQVEGDIFANNTQKVYHQGFKPSAADIGASRALTSANGYFGMTLNDGSTSTWIRTTVNGIIPYQSGGASALGTSSWPFNAVYSSNFYEGGSLLSSKYFQKSGGEISGEVVMTSNLRLGSYRNNSTGIYSGNGDGAELGTVTNNVSNGKANLILQSWYGIGFANSCSAGGPTGINLVINVRNGDLRTRGKVYNAVWNDYAEYFEKQDPEDQDFEPGDVIVSVDNKYVKSTSAYQETVIGVYSDSYGHIVGGTGDLEVDDKECIPVGLSGRVSVKVIGKVKNGQLLTSSDIAGVAMYAKDYKPGTIIGKAVEDKNTEEIGKVKMFIMNI